MTTEPKRGFAALSPERRREIAAAAGRASQASGRGHRFTPEEARSAGAKGGAIIAADSEHMKRIGRNGGKASQARKRSRPEAA